MAASYDNSTTCHQSGLARPAVSSDTKWSIVNVVPVMLRSTVWPDGIAGCRCLVRCGGLAVVSPQPVDVVRYGALDVVLRPEASVRPQPGGVEVVVRGPVGIAALREGDVRARNDGVDRGGDLAVLHQPSARDVVGAVVQPRREH